MEKVENKTLDEIASMNKKEGRRIGRGRGRGRRGMRGRLPGRRGLFSRGRRFNRSRSLNDFPRGKDVRKRLRIEGLTSALTNAELKVRIIFIYFP
ncbi:MAG: hypothetical protein MJ252_11015 [archaeon]|nr:hypothetical protein [archaeon]